MSDRHQSNGAALIAAERERQITSEGRTPDHDDGHGGASLAWAAVCYAAPERIYREDRNAAGPYFVDPFPPHWRDKRKDRANYPNAIPTKGEERIQMLVRAGALIAAEIDRLQRREANANGL